MPDLNSRGDDALGLGRCYLDDDTIIGQVKVGEPDTWKICTRPAAGGSWSSPISRYGATMIAARAGRWLGYLAGTGVFGADPVVWPMMGLAGDMPQGRGCAAADGTIAVILDAQAGLGLRLWAADGTFVDVLDARPDHAGVCVVDRTRAVWRDRGTGLMRVTGGLPACHVHPGQFGWPTALYLAGEWWLAYHSTDALGAVLHPFADPTTGYRITAPPAYYLAAVALDDTRVKLAWSLTPDDLTGREATIDVAHDPRVALTPSAPPDPIVAIGRPLWCGFFCFGEPSSPLPANCQIPVVQGVPWLPVLAGGRVIARYVAAEADGTIEGLERAIAATPAPSLAYWPMSLQTGRVPPGLVDVEANRLKAETIPAFERRIRTAVARTVACWLSCQGYTQREPSLQTTELASLVPVYARIARDCPQVQGLAVFSAGSREGGWDAHPEIHDAWRALFLGIPSAPIWEPPPPPPPPPPIDPPQPEEPMPLTDEQKEQVFRDLGVIVKRAYPDRVRTAEEAAQGIRQAWDQLQGNATASDLIAFALAREGGATTDEVEAAARAAVLLRRG